MKQNTQDNQNTIKNFNDSITFEDNLEKIFKKVIEEKLPPFLEYCIRTHNANPIMDVIFTISTNKF